MVSDFQWSVWSVPFIYLAVLDWCNSYSVVLRWFVSKICIHFQDEAEGYIFFHYWWFFLERTLLRCSKLPLDFGCCKLSHVISLKLRKKELLAKLSKFTKWQPFSLKKTIYDHTVNSSDWTLKKRALSNFAFQHC